MKLTRLAGFCGILMGLLTGLNVLLYDDWIAIKLQQLLGPFRPHPVAHRIIVLLPFLLVLLTVAGTYAHLRVSRVQKRVLIAVQMAGVIVALGSALLAHSGWGFVFGLFMLGAAIAWTGILLAVRNRKPHWILSAAMVVAGVGMLPLAPFLAIAHMHVMALTVGGITAMAWVLIGLTLLAIRPDQPSASSQNAD